MYTHVHFLVTAYPPQPSPARKTRRQDAAVPSLMKIREETATADYGENAFNPKRELLR